MGKIVCFGEIMMRLNPIGYRRLNQADTLEVTYAGGEANVAISLANFGENSCFISKVPENVLGQNAVNSLRQYGVDTSKMIRGGERLGIYFLEKGASQRGSKIIYDRKNSSIASAKSSEYNWQEIFRGANWFHFTGITPALSEDAAKAVKEACIAAKKAGVIISCDLNYRKNLWSRELAKEVMEGYMPYIDLLIANEEDAGDVLGVYADKTDIIGGELNKQGYISVAKKIIDKFGCDKVAITLRGSISANDNKWSAMIYSDGEAFFSKEYFIHIVDRLGGGDSFAGGLIYSLINEKNCLEAIEFAAAASCLKHTLEGDYNHVTVDEVNKLALGDKSGRVQR